MLREDVPERWGASSSFSLRAYGTTSSSDRKSGCRGSAETLHPANALFLQTLTDKKSLSTQYARPSYLELIPPVGHTFQV